MNRLHSDDKFSGQVNQSVRYIFSYDVDHKRNNGKDEINVVHVAYDNAFA